jgi:hypothetical protein
MIGFTVVMSLAMSSSQSSSGLEREVKFAVDY